MQAITDQIRESKKAVDRKNEVHRINQSYVDMELKLKQAEMELKKI